MPSTLCPDVATLEKLLKKELDAATTRSIQRHLENCATCSDAIRQIEDAMSHEKRQQAAAEPDPGATSDEPARHGDKSTVTAPPDEEKPGKMIGPYKPGLPRSWLFFLK